MTTVAPPTPPTLSGSSRGRDRAHHAAKAEKPRLRGGRIFGRRSVRWTAYGLAPVLAIPLAGMVLPLPFLDNFLAGMISERVANEVACPGTLAQPPKVTVVGDRLLPQALSQRLAELRLSLPDVTVGGAEHVAFDATLRDVKQTGAGTTQVGSMDASITVGFANMPAQEGELPTTYAQAPDGSLIVKTLSRAEDAKNVTSKLFLKMELRGESVATVPQRLQLFGQTLQAQRVADLTGGVRVQKLPDLPNGVKYKSINPRKDGVHVELGGVAVEPLSNLPKEVDGRKVTYQARNGQLGISTALSVPPIINVPLTIFTKPQLNGGTLTLVPQSVEILGANRPPSDPLARIVLSQIKQESLSRKLPAVPSGVTFRSVNVDNEGVKVAVAGVTVQPFSSLSSGEDRPATFGAEGGLLTATTKGGNPDGSPTPVVLYAKPRIAGDKLEIAPQQIQMFGILFPARNVLAQVRARDTTYPLQALPKNLAYQGVEVLPNGLKITMSGKNVTLKKGELTGGSSC